MTTFTAPTCSGQEEAVYLYLDDELPFVERIAFEQHLTTCPACQNLLTRAETLFAQVASIAPVTVPESAVSTAAEQVMARLPRTREMERFSPAVMVLLAAQISVGLILLVVTLPRLIAPYQTMLGSLAGVEVSMLLENTHFWIASLGNLTLLWLAGQWQQLVNLSFLDVSPQVAFIALAAFSLAWLLSNGLLLRGPASSMQNGGTS